MTQGIIRGIPQRAEGHSGFLQTHASNHIFLCGFRYGRVISKVVTTAKEEHAGRAKTAKGNPPLSPAKEAESNP